MVNILFNFSNKQGKIIIDADVVFTDGMQKISDTQAKSNKAQLAKTNN